MADPQDSGLEIFVPPGFTPPGQVAGAAPHGAGGSIGGFLGDLFGVFFGKNFNTIVAVGTHLVQAALGFVAGKPVFSAIRGIKIAGHKIRIRFAIESDDTPMPPWPPAAGGG